MKTLSVRAIVLSAVSLLPSIVLACGAQTLELLKAVEAATTEPPAFACGSSFNELLQRVHKKDWRGALSAYETHLQGLGKSEAGTNQADETLKYLKAKAGAP